MYNEGAVWREVRAIVSKQLEALHDMDYGTLSFCFKSAALHEVTITPGSM